MPFISSKSVGCKLKWLNLKCHVILIEKSQINGKKGHHSLAPFSPSVNTMVKDEANYECPPIVQPRIVSNSEKPSHVCDHHHSQIEMRVGVIKFSEILISFWFLWWCGGCLFTRFEERRPFWYGVGVFLKNFELNNSVF